MTIVSLYWVLLIGGGLYFISSLLGLDGDADMDVDDVSDMDIDDTDDSPKVFSLRLLFGAFLGFGIGATISYYNGWSLLAQLLIGAGTALLFAFLAYLLARMLHNLQGNSEITVEGVVGKVGIVTVQSSNTGTAMLKVNTTNGPQEFICRPEDGRVKLKVGEFVTILDQSAGQVTVARKKAEESA